MEEFGIVTAPLPNGSKSLNFFFPSGPKGIMQAKPVSGTLAKIAVARLLYYNNLCCNVIPKVTVIIIQMVTDS